jgi:endoglucanase
MIRLVCALLLFSSVARGATEPAKLAGSGRFDLFASPSVLELGDGQVVSGIGSIHRPNWIPEKQQQLAYTVNFPVSRLGWRELGIRFTPAQSGEVTLSLMGPWEEATKGVVYRQEILWDALKVEGASLSNGSFESKLEGWNSGGGVVERQTPALPALGGTHYARTWHNQPLSTTLQVRGGKSVTILVHSRAAVPMGFRDMKRIESKNTPAHTAAKRFLRGANLGNGLEAPPGQNWGVRYTTTDLHHIRAEGFDHVRIPIGWHHYAGPGPDYLLDPKIFQKVDALVGPAMREGLNVLINIHHFDDFTSDPKTLTPKFHAIWRQIAAHYAKTPGGLAFELLNEPRDAATTEVINPIFAETIRQIRKTNPVRTIVVGPGQWNGISELPNLRVPDNDLNLIVTVHCYDPFQFTHQGADWTGNSPDRRVVGIVFPGPPRTPLIPDPNLKLSPDFREWINMYNSQPREVNPCGTRVIDAAVAQIKEWSAHYGRPVYLGEFGAYTKADTASRAHYYRAFREALESAGIGWAIWDWKAGFRYWNEETNKPEPGMREALFGRTTALHVR